MVFKGVVQRLPKIVKVREIWVWSSSVECPKYVDYGLFALRYLEPFDKQLDKSMFE